MESCRRSPLGSRVLTIALVGSVALMAAACGSSTSSATATSTSAAATSGSPTSLVLSPAYAKSVGFPKTAVAAKTSSKTNEANCSQSAEAAYEDAAGQTGLVSETLVCNSVAAATAALDGVKKQVTPYKALAAPAALGPTAFVTATQAPQYTVIWRNRNLVGVTAIDVGVGASSSTTTTKPPVLTAAQGATLTAAAVAQNALYR